MAAKHSPDRITIRSYQVGFGDCFLLSFHYPARGNTAAFDRHVLIDFGNFPAKQVAGKKLLIRVAEAIQQDCGGKLHAVVATHRHADHVNGFTTANTGDGPGDIIAGCTPDVVIQPWTEDPDAQPKARRSTKPIPDGHKAFAAALRHMNEVAAVVAAEAEQYRGILRAHSGLGLQKVRELSFLGGNNIGNASAVKNLIAMGKKPGKRAMYVSYGTKSGLESVLPGVKTYVLGPPTLEQSESIRKQRISDPDEFWQLQAAALNGSGQSRASALPFARSMVDPRPTAHPYTRWLIPRLRSLRGEQLLEIVRQLDKQMNNTSVILLFETANQKLLFPGDAQIENWSYALREAENSDRVRELLAGVTFYKVGHHGSRNATPRSLWNLFRNRGTSSNPKRMTSIVSTEGGHHGSAANKSEVPRRTLVEALEKKTHFFTTERVLLKDLRQVISLDA